MNLKHANTLHYFIIIVSFSVLLIKSASLINNDHQNQHQQQPKNITITSTKTFQNSSSTIITKSNLREIFDFSGAGKGEGKLLITKKEFIDTSTPSSSFTHRMTSSTFRPTSSILFLTPPRPRHIASIVSELNSIELDPSGGYLTLRWSVIVVLKANSTEATTTNSTTSKIKRSTEKTKEEKEENEVENEEEEEEEVVVNLTSEKDTKTPLKNFTFSTTLQTPTNSSASSSTTTPENITTFTSTSISPAKVEQARTPLKWVITLRRYGHAHRERVPIEDRENNLDPPFTGNKSYHYRLEHLSPESSYELCIQSVNGGRLKESAEVRRLFPLNAHASGVVGGTGNPLFICKEVYVSPPKTSENKNNNTETDLFEVEILGSQRKSTKTQHKNRDQIRGLLAEGESSEGSETPAIEVSEEAADAFVVYTAITSGSTTVLLLIVVVTFCCCRCNKRKTEHREYRQNILYSRAPAGEGNGGGSHGEGSGSAPKYF